MIFKNTWTNIIFLGKLRHDDTSKTRINKGLEAYTVSKMHILLKHRLYSRKENNNNEDTK